MNALKPNEHSQTEQTISSKPNDHSQTEQTILSKPHERSQNTLKLKY